MESKTPPETPVYLGIERLSVKPSRPANPTTAGTPTSMKTSLRGAARDIDEVDDLLNKMSLDQQRSMKKPSATRKVKCQNCGEEHDVEDCPTIKEESNAQGKSFSEEYTGMAKEMNFDKYDKIPVEITGNNRPRKCIERFDSAGLDDRVLDNVRRAGYGKPTPIQKWALPIVLSGRDLMGCTQTGSGKTAAFLLPVITAMCGAGVERRTKTKSPMTLILGPTRELVIQIWNDACKFSQGLNMNIQSIVIYGGKDREIQECHLQEGADLVVATPGRLMDLIRQKKLELSEVKFLIFDEADRMLDMGFIDDMKDIVEGQACRRRACKHQSCRRPSMPSKTQRQTLMFSATFPEPIQELATHFLNDHIMVVAGVLGSANADITQSVYECEEAQKHEKLVAILTDSDGCDKTLVFVERKMDAADLGLYLSQCGFIHETIHANRTQEEREEALESFKSGKVSILVATSVASRGLDIPGVNHVINFDMPKKIEDYVHRIGRTGRCGNKGKSTSFFGTLRDSLMTRPVVKILEQAQQEVPDWLEAAAMIDEGGSWLGEDSRDIRPKSKFAKPASVAGSFALSSASTDQLSD